MSKKWNDPLDRLLEADQKSKTVTELYSEAKTERTEKPLKPHTETDPLSYPKYKSVFINPLKIRKWSLKDRPENEMGDIAALAQDMLLNGQQQPCKVRPIEHKDYDYELISGERRWRASQQAGIDLWVVIETLTDYEAAIAQASENSNRNDLSEYAKGMHFAKLIDTGVLAQKDLVDKLGISKQQVSRLLAFSKIPENILEAIGEMFRVSSGTAEKIKQLAQKGVPYQEALITIAPRIAKGTMGHEKLEKTIEEIVQGNNKIQEELKKIYSKEGRHMFTWRLDNNRQPSVHFPKDILNLMTEDRVDRLTERFLSILAEEVVSVK